MSSLNWRERFLAENNGILTAAAADFAAALAKGIDGLPGFSHTACLLASAEVFPEVTEIQIRSINDWEAATDPVKSHHPVGPPLKRFPDDYDSQDGYPNI